MKKKVITLAATLSLAILGAVPAMAQTVYYNGSAVSWDYGRSWGVFSYSDVQSGVYEHSATTFSGWKKAGEKAHAQQYVGTKTATAYWNCR